MEIEILNETRLRYWAGRIQLPEDCVAELARIAALTRGDEDLLSIFTAFYEKCVLRGEWPHDYEEFPIDPRVKEKLGDEDTMFYLLGYLSAMPHTEQEYLRRGIDLSIYDATLSDIRTWMVHCHEVYGKWFFNQFHWITLHLTCKLFRLGRMQYMLNEFEFGVTALRNKKNGEIVLLADPSVPLRADGYAYGAGNLPVTGEPWHAVYEETEAGWRGNAIAPMGYALPEVSFFSCSEWSPALRKGDTVLDLHIPRKDRFNMDDCRDSLRQAFQFFARYFPERPFQASACHTWFFTPQLQQIAPAESNIVRFQREFYLLPYKGSLAFLWFYVFGEGVQVNDRASAPNQTSLQRAVLDWLERGGEIFDLAGIMFHGPDEWGSQPYMRRFEEKMRNTP